MPHDSGDSNDEFKGQMPRKPRVSRNKKRPRGKKGNAISKIARKTGVLSDSAPSSIVPPPEAPHDVKHPRRLDDIADDSNYAAEWTQEYDEMECLVQRIHETMADERIRLLRRGAQARPAPALDTTDMPGLSAHPTEADFSARPAPLPRYRAFTHLQENICVEVDSYRQPKKLMSFPSTMLHPDGTYENAVKVLAQREKEMDVTDQFKINGPEDDVSEDEFLVQALSAEVEKLEGANQRLTTGNTSAIFENVTRVAAQYQRQHGWAFSTHQVESRLQDLVPWITPDPSPSVAASFTAYCPVCHRFMCSLHPRRNFFMFEEPTPYEAAETPPDPMIEAARDTMVFPTIDEQAPVYASGAYVIDDALQTLIDTHYDRCMLSRPDPILFPKRILDYVDSVKSILPEPDSNLNIPWGAHEVEADIIHWAMAITGGNTPVVAALLGNNRTPLTVFGYATRVPRLSPTSDGTWRPRPTMAISEPPPEPIAVIAPFDMDLSDDDESLFDDTPEVDEARLYDLLNGRDALSLPQSRVGGQVWVDPACGFRTFVVDREDDEWADKPSEILSAGRQRDVYQIHSDSQVVVDEFRPLQCALPVYLIPVGTDLRLPGPDKMPPRLTYHIEAVPDPESDSDSAMLIERAFVDVPPGFTLQDALESHQIRGVFNQTACQQQTRVRGYCYHPGLPCALPYCQCLQECVRSDEYIGCGKFCSCLCLDSPCKYTFSEYCSCRPRFDMDPSYSSKRTCVDNCNCASLKNTCDPDLCLCDEVDTSTRTFEEALALQPALEADRLCMPTEQNFFHLVRVGRSGIHGFGLFAAEEIKRDKSICIYTGEYVDRQESDNARDAFFRVVGTSYNFGLTSSTHGGQDVDAFFFGNEGRFANQPNNRNPGNATSKVVVLGDNTVQIVLKASQKIAVGQEITFDYNWVPGAQVDFLGNGDSEG
ncbi:SET domain [Carpediemonas membranifera]|uniref:SET domain n=1 Tax=Carpediemonas membranifera TaxID=201153 RepID=A0A8J6B467_9EUKA|nr:SET domain [Carpediemonas membranifera]|eukprot:KAG9392552.1 SET domain [Carpediemonas membranifera]